MTGIFSKRDSSRCLTKQLLNSHCSSMLTYLPPADVARELKCMFEKMTTLIRRVSVGSFAIRLAEMSQDQPLGVLHIYFTKPSQSPVFYCPCHSFSSHTSGPTTARLSKRCHQQHTCQLTLELQCHIFVTHTASAKWGCRNFVTK